MQPLTSAQRQHLRRLAHDIKPLAHIGKFGLNDQAVNNIDALLNTHELIKVKFLDFKDQREELTEALGARLDCQVVNVIGNTGTLYRPHPQPEKRKITLPPA